MSSFHIYVNYRKNGQDIVNYPNACNLIREQVEKIVNAYENGDDFLLGEFQIRFNLGQIEKFEIWETSIKLQTPVDWNQMHKVGKRVTNEFTTSLPGGRRIISQMHDLEYLLKTLKVPEEIENYLRKSLIRIRERSYSEAISNCYRVSEALIKILFAFLYPDKKEKRVKHEDKLKKIWNDEEMEKRNYPGIRVIASLLAVVLWYRNKMSGHLEMRPTKEGATICIESTLQALIEFNRLNIEITWNL